MKKKHLALPACAITCLAALMWVCSESTSDDSVGRGSANQGKERQTPVDALVVTAPERMERRMMAGVGNDVVRVIARNDAGTLLGDVYITELANAAPGKAWMTGSNGSTEVCLDGSVRPCKLAAYRPDLEVRVFEVTSGAREIELTLHQAPIITVEVVGADFPQLVSLGASLIVDWSIIRDGSNEGLAALVASAKTKAEVVEKHTRIRGPWFNMCGTSVVLSMRRSADIEESMLSVKYLDPGSRNVTFDIADCFDEAKRTCAIIVHAPLMFSEPAVVSAMSDSSVERAEVVKDYLEPGHRTVLARIAGEGVKTIQVCFQGVATFNVPDVLLDSRTPAVVRIGEPKELTLDIDNGRIREFLSHNENALVLRAVLRDSRGCVITLEEKAVNSDLAAKVATRLTFKYVVPGPVQISCEALPEDMSDVIYAVPHVFADVAQRQDYAANLADAGLLRFKLGKDRDPSEVVMVTVKEHVSGKTVLLEPLRGRGKGVFLPRGRYVVIWARGTEEVDLGRESEMLIR